MFSYSGDIVHSDFIRFLPGYVVHVEIHTVNAADTNALTSIPPACKQEMLELLAKPVKSRLELLENSHHRQQQKSLCFSEPQLLTGKTVKIAFSFKPSSIRNHSLLVKRDVGYRQLCLFPEKLVVFSYLSDFQTKVASNAVGVISSYFRSTDSDGDTSSILLASDCGPTITSKSAAQRSAVIVTDSSRSNSNHHNNSRTSSRSHRVVNGVDDVASTVSHVADNTNQTAAVCTPDRSLDALPCTTANISKHLSNKTESNITEKRNPDVLVRRKSTAADLKQQKSLSLSRFKFQPLNRIRHRLLKNAISPHVAAVHGSARRRSNISYRNSPASHTAVASSPAVSSASAVSKRDENSNRLCQVNQMRVETLSTKEQLRAASYDKLHCSPLLTLAAGRPKLSPTTTEGGRPVCSNSRNIFSTFGFESDCSSSVELRPVETSSDRSNVEKTLEADNCEAADHVTRLKLMPEKQGVTSVADAGSSTGCCVDINTVETIVIDDEDDVDGNSCSDVDKSRQHKEKLTLASQRRLVRKSSGSLSVTLLPLADMSAGPSVGRPVHKGETTPQSKVGKSLHISPSKQTTSQTHFRQSAHISLAGQPNGDHLTLQSPGREKLSSVDLGYEPDMQCKEVKRISVHEHDGTDADRQSYHKPTGTDLRTDASLKDDKDGASVKTCAKSVSYESVQLSALDRVTRRPLSRKLALKLHKKTRPDLSAACECDGSQNSSRPQTEMSCSFSAESKESKCAIKRGIVSSDSVDGLNVFDKMKDDSSCGISVKRELADDCSGGLNPKRARKSSDTDDSDDTPGVTIKETIILASRCSSADSELEEKSRLRTVLGITGGSESSGRQTKRNSTLNVVCCDSRKARQSLLCYDETQSIDVDELFDAQQVSQVVDEPLVTIEVDDDEDWCRMQQQISAIKNAADLTNEHLSYFVLSHERYLRDIFQGKKSCKRHVLYRNGGKDRRCLSWMLPVGLFTYEQHELVLGVLMEIFCKKDQKYFDYLLRVLLPEILIKIVMDVYGLEHDAAENKMRQRQNRL